MSENLDYHRTRYILMQHDPAGHNAAYLYPHTRAIEVVGPEDNKRSIDILQTVGQETGEDNAEYLAHYQLGRLQRGLIAASPRVFRQYYEALDEAQAIVLQELGYLVDKTVDGGVK